MNMTDVGMLTSRTRPLLRRNIGIVFQDFKLIPTRTVAENIGLALEVIGTPRPIIDRRIQAVLGVVGLHGRELMPFQIGCLVVSNNGLRLLGRL